jgi:hypothetical protein
MKGYVENITPRWGHVLKRSVGPGSRIPLKELYDQYGRKHELKKGKEFVSWLEDVKLKDKDRWQVVLLKTEKQEKEALIEPKQEVEEEVSITSQAIKEFTVSDVVNLSVRKAREALPNIVDIKLLRYAESEARQLAGKDSLCRLLKRRIQELELIK